MRSSPLISDGSSIDEMYFRLAKIRTFSGQRALTNATGFFFLQDEYLYLVTARHVVKSEADQHWPDLLQLSLHTNAGDLRQSAELSIPLYVDGIPQWYELIADRGVDIAVVAVNDPCVLRDHVVATFCAEDVLGKETPVPLGQDVLILGFPLGFHDTVNNLPLVRSAIIASSFSHPFKGDLYFVTDARLHRGMSGSPVIARVPGQVSDDALSSGGWKLLGVHTSSLDVSDRDPDQDERLALNTTWYASLLTEIIPARSDESPAKDSTRLELPPKHVAKNSVAFRPGLSD